MIESTIVSEGFKGGTRGAPIMPRDFSLSDRKCWNLVAKTQRWAKIFKSAARVPPLPEGGSILI